ncbi:hypothetical protein LX64_04927 [Chitinophaga skermanii]|uniref:NAD(P)-binding domain-containing protein n=1 Tax=Chitinophaga skermanii TaxID=331697 RepID=A0A327Q2A0_9BACT|nr:NAD(P)-dependent oxidoreductase [Chitinophaga skermanii]RAI97877.1 hypothetical protein LX64_04927 [Chitinophaga skermanii]
MKLAIIGASGFVGSAILEEALSRGITVKAIVRHPEKIQTKNPQLNVVKGDALNEDELVDLVKDQDAVISAYNAGWDNPDILTEQTAANHTILDAIRRSGVKRFLAVGGAGSLEVAPGVQLLDTPDFPEQFKGGAIATRDMLVLLKKDTELDWTFLCPPISLDPGERTGNYREGKNQVVFDAKGHSHISVKDYAVAMIDELQNNKHIKERFTVAY